MDIVTDVKPVEDDTVEEVTHESPENVIRGNRNPLLQFVILTRLYRFADTEMLQVCRQVCKVWNDAAIHVLKTRLVDLTLCQPPDESEQGPHHPQLQSFLDFDEWRVKNNLSRDFAFWDLTLYDIREKDIFIKLLEGGWRSTIRKLQLRDFTSVELNYMMKNLIRSLPNLTNLILILSINKGEEVAVPIKHFGEGYVEVKDTERGPWTSPLKQIEIRACGICSFEFQWNFINFCPNLNSLLLDFHGGGKEALAKFLKDLQTSYPEQKITKLELMYFHTICPSEYVLHDQAIEFINFYSVKEVAIGIIRFEKLLECLRSFKPQAGIQSLCFVARILKYSDAESYECALEMLHTLTTAKWISLTSLTIKLNCCGKVLADSKDHKPSYWGGSSSFNPLNNLTKLKFACGVRDADCELVPETIKFTFGFLEKLPQVFPNLVEFKGCHANLEEFRHLITQLSQLHNFQTLSIHWRWVEENPELLCNKTLFGIDSEDKSYKGLFGLKKLRTLSLTGSWCENINEDSIKEGFAKLLSLKYLTISL